MLPYFAILYNSLTITKGQHMLNELYRFFWTIILKTFNSFFCSQDFKVCVYTETDIQK